MEQDRQSEPDIHKRDEAQGDTTEPWVDATPGMPLADATPVEGRRLGKFLLVELCGRGGFGYVFRARDPVLEHEVALKVARPELVSGPGGIESFLNEARAAARLRHPHIVTVHEAGEIDGNCFIVYDFIEGFTLRDRLRDGPRPSWRETAVWVRKIAVALHHAHTMGIIHRDVKPENVILEGDEPLITDFGLALRETPQADGVGEGALLGTPAYMSPEQARGEAHLADARSDLWSLGVMLYELLLNRRPFDGERAELLRAIEQQQPIAPRIIDPSLPKDLEAICLKCLAKPVEQRHASCGVLADELGRWLDGKPVESRPISRFHRVRLWCRRNPRLAVLTGSLLMLSVLILGLVVGFARRESDWQEREHQQTAESKLQEAQLARKDGNWRRVLSLLDESLRLEHSDSVMIRLEKIRALDALEETAEWAKEVEAISALANVQRHEGDILLWRSFYLRSLGKQQEGFSLVSRALEYPLSASDAAYARSLLADTSPEAVDLLRRSLEADKLHHRAREDLVGLLVSLGERREARMQAEVGAALFPEDPSFPGYLAIICAIDGDLTTAHQHIEQCRGSFGDATAGSIQGIVDTLVRLREVEVLGGGFDDLISVALAAAKRSAAVLRGLSSDDRAGVTGELFRIPQPVLEAYTAVSRAIMPNMGNLLRGIMGQDTTNTIDGLREATRKHPEGLLYFAIGWYLYDQGQSREAETAFVEAAKRPWIVPLVREDRWSYAMQAAAAVFVEGGRELDDLQRAVDYGRRVIAEGEIQPQHANLLRGLFRRGQERGIVSKEEYEKVHANVNEVLPIEGP